MDKKMGKSNAIALIVLAFFITAIISELFQHVSSYKIVGPAIGTALLFVWIYVVGQIWQKTK